ncbi:CoA pyrophosphatase [Uruburuella testudinis]|uniref:CoA pyrophosphatase n=1 Tax=Uruburuella testudinis TaxID=1282863 RepID=A0ABY4DX03_9NEIS|nr:CoA pyrophosphatase [Uruburuella testudinis]UOO82599.1 CoA pyrophosphatase [Uruburuella testudinis]
MTHTELVHFFQHAARYPTALREQRNLLLDTPQPREAAVLLATVYRHRQWQLLLTRRADTLRHHTGQIALAGGRRDPQDLSLIHTALRETAEETGIGCERWQTFPQLPPYYTPTGYAVSPVPAVCPYNPNTQANVGEVAEIFYLPLDFALHSGNYTRREFQYNGRTLHVPALPYRHYDIWGLTAMILYDLAERYRQYRQAV